MSRTLASRLIQYYQALEPPDKLPKGVEILFPLPNGDVMKIVREFFYKYYNDNNPRQLLFGINPGRFGAGITGINFTAPRQLKNYCKLAHPFGDTSELSAEFIYEVAETYGGVSAFYSNYFISAVSPLGFLKGGINLNYYDDKKLQDAVTPFIVENIKKQLSFGFKTNRCICVGGEKNFKFLDRLNNEYHFFREIIPLPHPRFIMQYRRKKKDAYIRQYLTALRVME